MSIAAFFVDQKVDSIDLMTSIGLEISITSTFHPLPHESSAIQARAPGINCSRVPTRAIPAAKRNPAQQQDCSTTSQLRKLRGTGNLHRYDRTTSVPTDERASGRTLSKSTSIMAVHKLLDDTVVCLSGYVQRLQTVSHTQVQWIAHVLAHQQAVHIPAPASGRCEPRWIVWIRSRIRSTGVHPSIQPVVM